MKKLLTASLSLLVAASLITGCKKAEDTTQANPGNTDNTDITKLVVNPAFKYNTTTELRVTLRAKDYAGTPFKAGSIQIFDADPTNAGTSANLIAQGGIDPGTGMYDALISVPTASSNIYIRTNYVGLISNLSSSARNGAVDLNLVPVKMPSSGRIISPSRTNQNNIYTYMGTYDSQGVPTYLISPDASVDAGFFGDINAALPERRPVPINHPEYIASSTQSDIILTDSADIYVTFMSEGASYRNALGYYTYNPASPPTSVSQIAKRNIVYPNASLPGSGGNLATGSRVHLGRFKKNTAIGWFIVANGWNGTTVGDGLAIYYSNDNLNPESTPAKRAHNVMFRDAVRNKNIIGFEDLNRDPGNNSDEDFNDLVFFVEANPFSAISSNGTIPLPNVTDTDGDGVPDGSDDFDTDPLRAHILANQIGTLCYEDLWPSQGDYDFNDLVVYYNYSTITNAANAVKEIRAKYYVRAIGASFNNGFAVQFPNLQATNIQSVTRDNVLGTLFPTNANGTESGVNNAVLPVFGSAFTLSRSTGGAFYNTELSWPKGTGDTVRIAMILNNPVALSTFGVPPYDPFIAINQERGKEVHLADFAGTTKVTNSFYGTVNDNSIPGQARYYRNSNNLPWALHIVGNFDYPIEKQAITTAYLNFAGWAQSSGANYADWYKNLPGYRNASNIYSK